MKIRLVNHSPEIAKQIALYSIPVMTSAIKTQTK